MTEINLYNHNDPPPVSCPANYQTYTIQPGDTYYRLAQKLETTINALLTANPGINPSRLVVGQTICVPFIPFTEQPVIGPTRPCPRAWDQYTAQPGDTLYRIAASVGTTVNVLLAYNPTINPTNLQVGQILCVPPPGLPGPIPLPPPCPIGLMPYTIRPGDTIWVLARERNTSVENILGYNPTIDPSSLRVGQVICIP